MTRFLTAHELAEQLRVSPETIRAWARQGRIPRLRIGARPLLFDPDEVEAALRSRRKKASEL